MTKYLTAQGLEKLKKELEYLEKDKRKEVTERLRHTIAQGDLRENAGYHAAKEQQGFVEGRIQELKDIISESKVVAKGTGDSVQVGSCVCLESDQGEETFEIVDPEEADILQNKISFKSPLGQAIFGRKAGDVVEMDAPGGKRKYEIVEIK